MDGSKKRKRPNKVSGSGFTPENITTVRHLQGLLGDFSSQDGLNNGLQHFKAFLGRCSKCDDVSDEEMKRNLGILKEWLDIQSKSTSGEDEGEGQGNTFIGILQVWSYASQNNSLSVLSTTMASLAVLIRTCSYNEDLKPSGAVLCKSILQPTYLRIVYRSLVSNKDFIASPCLRLLTEINKFDFGSVCGLLHSALDFTTKGITKNLEVSGGKGETAIATDDLHKPSLRTTFVRFVLSFFQFGSPSVRNELLGQRAWISPIFKYLGMDTPLVVNDVLEVMSKKVVTDKEVPRATKHDVFNDWVLKHIVTLYKRTDIINTTKAGKDEEKTVAQAAHEFLVTVCTTPGNGVCYSDSGWYPPGSAEPDEKRRGGPKLHNRTLSSFVMNIRPYADTLQQDLLLEIFKAFPELVADYHLNNTSFDFDPKLTSTWIGYYTFLSSVVQLPVPINFGLGELSVIPPPTSVIIENVMPRSLGKATLARCLAHPNSLIKFFVTRLLLFSFQKLRKVLTAIDDASASMVDPSFSWTKTRFELVEEFCKRVPDMGAVVGLINSSSKGQEGKLQKEAASRLLADYYESISEVALAGKFDITIALGNFLASESASSEEDKELRLLEMGHLLRVAKDVPDVKWWNKSGSIPFSPFVSILKVCCGPSSNLPLRQIRTLLHSIVAPSPLFQKETPTSPLEALLESLLFIRDPPTFEAILSFLDQSVAQCIRGPFKYIDDLAELAFEISKTNQYPEGIPAVSPFTMTLVEQWKYFLKLKHTSSTKQASSVWLARFLESSAILGENEDILGALCGRLTASCNESGQRSFFRTLQRQFDEKRNLQLFNSVTHANNPSSPQNWPRALFDGLGKLNAESVTSVAKSIRENKIDVSLFDLAVGQRAILEVLKSQSISSGVSCSVLPSLVELLETILLRLKEEGENSRTWEGAKQMLVSSSELVGSLLEVPDDPDDLQRYAYFSKSYSNILATVFDDYQPILSSISRRVVESLPRMGGYLSGNPDDSNRTEIISTYKIIIDHLSSHNDVLDCIRSMDISEVEISELEFDVLAHLIHRISMRDEHLPLDDLVGLLTTDNMPKAVCNALAEYINRAPKETLESFDPESYSFDFEAELHEWSVALDSALIRKIKSARDMALVSLYERMSEGRNIPHLAKYLTALLECFSVPTADASRFEWSRSTTTEAMQQMETLFSAAQTSMFEGSLDAAQVELLQRAASLFASLDREGTLKKVTADNRSSNLTAETAALLVTLVKDMDFAGSESKELLSWLLMVFDRLTRRYSEDNILSKKTLGFTKNLGRLLSEGKINLSSSVPRETLNAVLEAGLQKQIDVPEVLYFVAVVVSQLSAKDLDLAKLLQMTLGHTRNPLLLRDNYFSTQEICYHSAYIIYRLFSLAKSSQANITTLDGILGLYRGSNDVIDISLLDIIHYIESHLGRSLATRIATWTIVENANGNPLISRVRGKFNVVIDAKTLARSIFQSSPTRLTTSALTLASLNSFMAIAEDEDQHLSQTYDLDFILPALTYIIFSEGNVVDVQAMIVNYCVAFAIMGLCADRTNVRKMAISYISLIASKLEDSTYREKKQLSQLLCSILASVNVKEDEDGQKGMKKAIPTIVGVFLAQATQVLSNPGHFLYEKVMELLLRRPLLDLTDLPLILQFSISGVGDEYQKEIGWILNILAAGLGTEEDLDIYRKRNIFGNCLSLYLSPYSTNRVKEKVIELLWNAAGVEGGGTTLITRNGVISFIEGQLCHPTKEKTLLKRLAARLYESSAKEHVRAWSKGNIQSNLVEGIFVK